MGGCLAGWVAWWLRGCLGGWVGAAKWHRELQVVLHHLVRVEPRSRLELVASGLLVDVPNMLQELVPGLMLDR